MEGEEDMFPPFWLQTSDHSLRPANRHRGRSSSSFFFSSGAFVLALLAIALVFVFFIIPSTLSFTSQIFKPHLVKKNWDSLNLVLVLFAIVCGFLSRNTNNDNNYISSPSSYDHQLHHPTVFNAPIASEEVQKSNPSTPRQWYDQYSDRTAYMNHSTNTMNRVRASSSYPDLRQQEASWVARDERWRFYDDTHVASYRVSGSDQPHGPHHHHRRHRSWHEESVQEEAEEHVKTKNIPVDTFVIRTEEVNSSYTQIPAAQSDPPPPRSPSPPPQPLPRKTKRTYQALGEKEKSTANDNLEVEKKLPPPPSRPPPSPPPLPLKSKDVESKRPAGQNVNKGVATTKEFLITSLRRKKKKQRQKSVENFETLLGSASSPPSSSLLRPPSPPPLPPPPSVFHNLFSSKKSSKPKKMIHSIPQPPPPSPPPPPPAAITSTARLSKTKAQPRPMMTTQKPSLPVRVSNFSNVDDENSNSGGESPMVRIPPPLPPFRMPEMKFVVHGDFVRIKSHNSSRSGSPDLDDDDQDSVSSPTMEASTSNSTPLMESGESPKAGMFCPSPDVNSKAETFIARVRAGLRLEKMNSVKEKRERKSNLGPHIREGEGPSY